MVKSVVENSNKVAALRGRVEPCQEAVATFVRIQEELLTIRKASAFGAARKRLDRMLKLNRETMSAVRRSLEIAETELHRAER